MLNDNMHQRLRRRKQEARILPDKAIIGMIHVPPLPGSMLFNEFLLFNEPLDSASRYKASQKLLEKALGDLTIYQKAGIDAIMLENMHDVPYAKPPLKKETFEAMREIAHLIRLHTNLPIGIQLLEAANCEAMEIACHEDLDFIRAEGYVYAHIGGSGLIEGSAQKIQEVRKKHGGNPNIKVFADVKKKHCAHALTGDLTVADIAFQSEFFCADGVIITGKFTGEPADIKDLMEIKKRCPKLYLLIGSGITAENLGDYYDLADSFIVGSYFKKDGYWKNDLDPERIKRMIEKRNQLKNREEKWKK